ncbi:TPA: hypothetical protein ACTZ2N_005218 [Bacillus cereus]
MGTIMKINRYRDTSEDGSSFKPVLIEKNEQITILPGKSQYVPINMEHNEYDIRTLQVTNENNVESTITIFDKKEEGNQLYKSLSEKRTYDILAIPCQDKDFTNTAHIYIVNKGAVASVFDITIKAISLN